MTSFAHATTDLMDERQLKNTLTPSTQTGSDATCGMKGPYRSPQLAEQSLTMKQRMLALGKKMTNRSFRQAKGPSLLERRTNKFNGSSTAKAAKINGKAKKEDNESSSTSPQSFTKLSLPSLALQISGDKGKAPSFEERSSLLNNKADPRIDLRAGFYDIEVPTVTPTLRPLSK